MKYIGVTNVSSRIEIADLVVISPPKTHNFDRKFNELYDEAKLRKER